jgi:hypothetical protein
MEKMRKWMRMNAEENDTAPGQKASAGGHGKVPA